jgi:hypothetical protein
MRNPPMSGKYILTVYEYGKEIFTGECYYSQNSGWNYPIRDSIYVNIEWSYKVGRSY